MKKKVEKKQKKKPLTSAIELVDKREEILSDEEIEQAYYPHKINDLAIEELTAWCDRCRRIGLSDWVIRGILLEKLQHYEYRNDDGTREKY